MTPFIVTMVLLAALLHAGWNAMAKSGGQPQFSIASYRLFSAIACFPLLFILPLPLPESWVPLFLSVLIHSLYYISLSRAYLSGDLSQVYPIFRGLAPVLVVIGAALFAGEYLPIGALLGIGLISLGLISIALVGGKPGRITGPALGWGLVTAILIASYTVADGIGVRAAGNAFSYIAWLFVLEPIPIGLWLLLTDRGGWMNYMTAKTGKIVAGALAAALAYAMVIYAMSLAPLAMVSSLRETSVIFAAIIGTLMFREPFGRQRVVAAVLVCAGVAAIKLLG